MAYYHAMTQDALARRLRITGIGAVIVVLLVALAQMGFVEWLIDRPLQSEVVNQSGLRRADIYAVLYQAERVSRGASTQELRSSMSDLDALQRGLADLSPAQQQLYDSFRDAANGFANHPRETKALSTLETVGPLLYQSVSNATDAGIARAYQLRGQLANVTHFGGAAIVLVVLALYVFIIRRGEAAILRAVDAIEERRERFAAIFDHGSEMMTLYAPDGTIVRSNRAALERLGFGRDAVGKQFAIHIARNERENVARNFALAVAGQATQFPTVFIDSRGNEVPVLASITPVRVRGEVVAVIGMGRDVSGEREFQALLMRTNERFRSLFRRSRIPMWALDVEGIVTEVNPAMCELIGWDESELIGKSALSVVPPNDISAARPRLMEILRGNQLTYESRLYTREGVVIPIEVDVTPIIAGGRLEGVFVASRDLTKERAMLRRLDSRDRLVRTLLDMASSSFDAGAFIDFAIPAAAHALGMGYGYVVSIKNDVLTVRHRFGADDYLPLGHTMPVTNAVARRLLANQHALAADDLTEEPFASELQDRGLPWRSYIGSQLRLRGKVYGIVVLLDKEVRRTPFEQSELDFVDVMSSMVESAIAREIQDESLRDQAAHDPLTGLANRSMLNEHFARMVARAERTKTPIAAYYIDLDAFKPINDRHGHAAGDEVLRTVAKRFLGAVRGEDVVARVGGDEFVVLQSEADQAASSLKARIEEAMQIPVDLANGVSVDVGASIGIAHYPAQGRDLETLLEVADAQMYVDKQAGKNQRP